MTGETKNDLAQARNDLAEDRTALANERTFAGWMRTGLAAIGIGVGFHALFSDFDPTWVAKAVATLFILIGVVIFCTAQHRATEIRKRLDTHQVRRVSRTNLRILAILTSAGAAILIAGIWLLTGPSQ